MATVQLSDDERKVLTRYLAEDPSADAWIAPWALRDTGLDFDTAVAGRELCRRKLVEGDPNTRGKWRGYSITDKGKASIA